MQPLLPPEYPANPPPILKPADYSNMGRHSLQSALLVGLLLFPAAMQPVDGAERLVHIEANVGKPSESGTSYCYALFKGASLTSSAAKHSTTWKYGVLTDSIGHERAEITSGTFVQGFASSKDPRSEQYCVVVKRAESGNCPSWKGTHYFELIRGPDHSDLMIVYVSLEEKTAKEMRDAATVRGEVVVQAFEPKADRKLREADKTKHYVFNLRREFEVYPANLSTYKVSGSVHTADNANKNHSPTPAEDVTIGLFIGVKGIFKYR